MNRTALRVGQSGAAGAVIALGVGIGAYNAWWAALFPSIPLVVAGLLLVPRPSRTSELDVFDTAPHERSVPVRVQALTRSSLSDDDLQPTLVTATVSPPHDTAFQARWITPMTSGHFRSLTASPITALAPDRLPSRDAARTPEFGDQPGKWAVIFRLWPSWWR
jgi:hypothetical protein